MAIGVRLFGKVDQADKVCYVATEFFTMMFLPLIPIRSWVVISSSELDAIFYQQWRGVPIRLNLKSIVFAWARAPLVVFGFAAPACVWFSYSMTNATPMTGWEAALTIAAGLASLTLFGATYWLSRASQSRALEIRRLVGLQ